MSAQEEAPPNRRVDGANGCSGPKGRHLAANRYLIVCRSLTSVKSRHRIAPAHTKIPPPTYDAHQKGTTCGHLCSDEVIHSTTTFSSFQAVGSCVVSFCGFGRLSESTSIPIVSSEIHAHERDLSRQLGWLILLEPTWVNSVERHSGKDIRFHFF